MLMIVDWMRVGFVHGVMNTDNMSIHGLTIDYGLMAGSKITTPVGLQTLLILVDVDTALENSLKSLNGISVDLEKHSMVLLMISRHFKMFLKEALKNLVMLGKI